jgi:hypothetical protein
MGVMYDAIQDGVRVGRVPDETMPFVHGGLTGDNC